MKELDLSSTGFGAPAQPKSENAGEYVPQGVCSKLIRFEIEGDTVANVQFTGGCDGNLKAVSALVQGRPVAEVVATLSGIRCGRKNTSCADQLCRALDEHMATRQG